MNTFLLLAKDKDMKKSTKIILIIFIAVTVPALVLGGSLFSAIVPTDNGFTFNFDTKAIIALILFVASIILGIYLYWRFLLALSLDKVLFFSSIPLFLIYGATMFLITDLSNINSPFAASFRSLLNISTDNAYNTILWAILVSLVFIAILFFNYIIICRPFNKVEKVISRLGDGRVREEKLNIGGGKQFKNIEHGLVKINNKYRENDKSLKNANLETQKFVPKQFFKFLGKGNITELELGHQVKKYATLVCIKLEGINNKDSLSLEDNFNILNSYLNVIAPLVRKFNGFIDRYLGDGIIAVFPNAENAINCSLAIIRAMRIENRSNKKLTAVKERISILSGEVIFGIVGDEERKIPTIVSNETSLLEKMDEIVSYMSSKMVFTKSVIDNLPLNYKLVYRYIGSLNMDEFKEVMLFEDLEVYSKEETVRLIKNKGLFERGVIFYNNGEYQKAMDYFRENLKSNPNDKGGYIYFNKTKEKLNEE